VITRDNGATNIAHNDATANAYVDAINANYCGGVHELCYSSCIREEIVYIRQYK
jgi:hypothetical protein